MPENIVTCNCNDCKQPMEGIEQPRWNGGKMILLTCWNKACDLHAVTMNSEQYAKFTEAEFEAYRIVNRENRAKGALWSADDTQPITPAFDGEGS